jgi:uncharacterized membrane protein YcaP (DUF421 family)
MFVLGVPIAEKMIRPILVYGFLVIGLRLAGKRELVQLNPFDLVVLLMISNTIQNAIIGDDNSVTGGLIGAATLLVINHVVVRFFFRHRRLEEWLTGEATPLIENGHVLERNLAREIITIDELKQAAHRQGFMDLSRVQRAMLEPGGFISFLGADPSADVERHAEVMQELRALRQAVAALEAQGAAH